MRSAANPETDAFSDRFATAIGGRDREKKHFKPKKAFQKLQQREREQEEEGGRKSRSKRFNDPEFSFGKKSLVYQLNRGDLKDKVAKILDNKDTRDDNASKRPSTEDRPTWNGSFRPDRTRRPSDFRGDRASSTPAPGRYAQNMRSMRDGARRELEGDNRGSQRYGSRQSGDDSFARRTDDVPMSVQYTTAASQFLFGRSVVKAALRNSRRKLYRLYIYQGGNKKDSKDDDWILSMAEKKNVKVTRVYESDQKLLDKMSKGRPHNGIVIEASPLPQLPLTGLGAESKELKGYPVSVAHQSKEAVIVNGTEGIIPYRPGTARPLVLLLSEILDPGNLGAILRTARFLGVSAVAITQRTSSTITSTVLKAAAGAAEELRLFSVEDPVSFLDASQKAGWVSYAAVAPTSGSRAQSTPESIEQSQPLNEQPCILVLGNEGAGLPYDIRKTANHEITIPRMMATSSVDSLNVSVAAALLCNSFMKGTQPLSLTERLQKAARKADGGEALF
ncbi:rRNA methyltransferase 1, mitochondrial [Colletotrichum chlorophyti]|uniref:rRNA methyltransferase 1, mitochondrial n=1 Tax=Colletotrichum chlorophyti TaxID=708187 RepID=A0A1Q8RNT0_9PEZI|nr:rRNA methyltransferase 1, mitochondrial [Colletotrichum chlorophyti]